MSQDRRIEPSGVVLRRESGLPIYLQVVDQLRYLIGAGRFRVGDYLPPMRQIADELGLNLNTVLRAYAELQRDGLIRSTRGKGAVVVRNESASTSAALRAPDAEPPTIDAMIASAVEHALSAGLEPAEVLVRTQAALDSVGSRAPVGPLLIVFASPAWRARILAEALRDAGLRRVRSASNSAELSGADLVIRPVFGASEPDAGIVGAPTLDVALLLNRSSVRELLEIDPKVPVLVVAGDDGAATWMADAVASYAVAGNVRRTVVQSTGDADFQDAAIVVVEAGMPRGTGVPDGVRVIQAKAVFPASIAENVELRTTDR